MQPNQPANPVQGANPLVFVALLESQIQQNSVNAQGVIDANRLAGQAEAWRAVNRKLAVDTASGQWGTPDWTTPTGDQEDPNSEKGTTNLHWFLGWMTGHIQPGSNFPPDSPGDGNAEVQILFQGLWYSAASILAGNPQVPINQAGVQNIYGNPPAPPNFKPISDEGNPIVTAPTTKDFVGSQKTAWAWNVTVYGYTMISQSPDPDSIMIDGPGQFTSQRSPTGKFYYNANPMFAGSAFWTSVKL